MSDSHANDVSLAFVDVITNGLGGMLVLFFIVVLIQTQLEWADQSTSQQKNPDAAQPFVLVVTALDGAAPFTADALESVWRFDGIPPGSLEPQRGRQWDWGTTYAVFVSGRPLGLSATANLRSPAEATRFHVDVYPAGAEKKSYVVQSVPGAAWTEVWPALHARDESDTEAGSEP